ncbi:MAG: Gar1/Naf1 family protein, partial [Candidatus Bathyarchaeota archaeon]|nr:Gar1/Naf1 family protein [Candidatus Bathyarchaeota archaeon]
MGELSHFMKNGKILLRGGEVPALYSSVITAQSKHVGKVVDVIGPVSNPYVIVKPESKITEKELSST